MRTLSESTTRRAERVILDDDARRQAERWCIETRQPRLFTALPSAAGAREWLASMTLEYGHCGQ